MNNQVLPWRAPVKVRLQSGLERIFLTVSDALDFLEHEWPLRRGQRYDRALRKCRAALNFMTPTEVAREAFIAACLEAGMPMVMTGSISFSTQKSASAVA